MTITGNTLLLQDHPDLKTKMLNWANRFNIFCFADSNGYASAHSSFEGILAAGSLRTFEFTGHNDFKKLQDFHDSSPSWLFGHLDYNAGGNAYNNPKPTHADFGKGYFFEPEIVLQLDSVGLTLLKGNMPPAEIFSQILLAADLPINIKTRNTAALHATHKEVYLQKIRAIQGHIQKGDCYELNFCTEFNAEETSIDPVQTFIQLSRTSAAPFAVLYKKNRQYCIGASPERFLKKTGSSLLSQPIKGTIKRDKSNRVEDDRFKEDLLNSAKDRSENVMIADLVRNDMSKVCARGSVKVSELFGMYSFANVHHLITSIEGVMPDEVGFAAAIEACYPMGSMTGAPKKKVMELIEAFEASSRGLFSGSIGYITPDADFDFNVVIRSIFYDSEKGNVSFSAGSGITVYSDPEEEYKECMVKAEAMINIISQEQ